jgi:hypothetical protein
MLKHDQLNFYFEFNVVQGSITPNYTNMDGDTDDGSHVNSEVHIGDTGDGNYTNMDGDTDDGSHVNSEVQINFSFISLP